ncbi:MAG TPA: hypothetical protein VD994_15320 [Prosthecobacter sp.]|nr:hypothetical protein [Prosthecobacter sp.]
MSDAIDIDLSWGGYYASTNAEDGGKVTVFRLLDFNTDAYQAALFTEEFASMPTLEEVADLSPFIGHVPIDARALLQNRDLRLLGSRPLSRDDLVGYAYYLEDHGMTPEEIRSLQDDILQFTQQPPLRLRLELANDELVVSERK